MKSYQLKKRTGIGFLKKCESKNVIPQADALLISGTGLPTAGIIQRLEDELGKPVVTGQSAALWQALRVAGVDAGVKGYGRLLA